MTATFLPLPLDGYPVEPRQLTVRKAREVAQALQSELLNWVSLIECQQHHKEVDGADGPSVFAESVAFEVDVEIPQRPVHNIRRRERIAATFSVDDCNYPEVHALRGDFPLVPHLNLRHYDLPRSMCLFDEPYQEIKLRWTAPEFIERIRTWLAETAAGRLHKEDQALEPFFIGGDGVIVLPSDMYAAASTPLPEKIELIRTGTENRLFLAALKEREFLRNLPPGQRRQTFMALPIVGRPQVHGVIHRQPRFLPHLAEFLQDAQIDLLEIMRDRLRVWQSDSSAMEAGLVLILILPKTRLPGSEEESREVRAFLCTHHDNGEAAFPCIKQIGEQLGLWSVRDNNIGLLVPPDLSQNGENIGLLMLNTCSSLSRNLAAICNGSVTGETTRITAVGLGALGSQVFLNLLRAGYGEWQLIDKDYFLPHNLTRHALYGKIEGLPKSQFLADVANRTIDGTPIASAIVADVLDPGESREQIINELKNSEVILDCSASIAVARYLGHDVDSAARRISMFLNPSGCDLVLLAEDTTRKYPLTLLEMQYYRGLITESDLLGHLRAPNGRIRYGYSCRDLSNIISQDRVALCAAIGSLGLKQCLNSELARIIIWRSDEDGCVRKIPIAPAIPIFYRIDGWAIYTDERLIGELRRRRAERLPAETGGILIGSHDMQRKHIYVMDALPSPTDSIEEVSGYVRGSRGLKSELEKITERTAGNLDYIGEWHSHPNGHSSRMSSEDVGLLGWLSRRMAAAGKPSLMYIMGDESHTWNIGSVQ